VLHRFLIDVLHRLVGDDEQVAVGQRQRTVRSAGEGRRPVTVRDHLRVGLVLDVEDDQPAVAPRRISDIAGDERVVEGEAALPGRRLTAGLVHAGDPPAPGFLRVRGIGHVDDEKDVVRVAVEKRRGIGVAVADPPHAMEPQAFDLHEADRTGLAGLRYVVDAEAGRIVLAALAEVGTGDVVGGFRVVGLLGVVDRVEVELLDHQQKIAVALAMQGPRARVAGEISGALGLPRIAHVDKAPATAERMADMGEALVDHDLHPVGLAALIGVAEEFDAARAFVLGSHRPRPFPDLQPDDAAATYSSRGGA
jgi:hypothetical protein